MNQVAIDTERKNLSEGDKVVYNGFGGKRELRIGYFLSFTPKGIRVGNKPDDEFGYSVRDGNYAKTFNQ